MGKQHPQVGDVYLHANGYKYTVTAIGMDADAQQAVVIHRGHHDGRDWARPWCDFNPLSRTASGKQRFKLV